MMSAASDWIGGWLCRADFLVRGKRIFVKDDVDRQLGQLRRQIFPGIGASCGWVIERSPLSNATRAEQNYNRLPARRLIGCEEMIEAPILQH